MKSVTIPYDFLVQLIEQEVRKASFGNAPIKISSIQGITEIGGAEPITGLYVTVESPKPRDFLTPSAPAGKGKIKLATIDGEEV